MRMRGGIYLSGGQFRLPAHAADFPAGIEVSSRGPRSRIPVVPGLNHGLRRGLTGEFGGILVNIRVLLDYFELIYPILHICGELSSIGKSRDCPDTETRDPAVCQRLPSGPIPNPEKGVGTVRYQHRLRPKSMEYNT